MRDDSTHPRLKELDNCHDKCRTAWQDKGVASLPHNPEPTLEQALGTAEIARILGVHPRTLERRRRSGQTARPLAEQREEKLRRIWRDLVHVFTPENAAYWLRHPVPVLENRRPVDVMSEDGGLDRVLETVGRMSWGIPA